MGYEPYVPPDTSGGTANDSAMSKRAAGWEVWESLEKSLKDNAEIWRQMADE